MPEIAISKSVFIDAPIDRVHAAVRDFRQWPKWSPWLITDPDCEVGYGEGGCSYSWNGAVCGSGEMVVVNEVVPRAIDYKLTFRKPWESVAAVGFRFADQGAGTGVTWTMESSLPFFMFFLKRMLEGFVGMDYQRGLVMLKDFVEMGMVPSKLEFLGRARFSGGGFVGVRNQCRLGEIGRWMGDDFAKLRGWLEAAGVRPAGAPFSICHKWDRVKGIAQYTAGIPLAAIPDQLPAGFVSGELPDCDVYSVKHTGPYRHLGNAWASGMVHARGKKFRRRKGIHPFEVYENSPADVGEIDLVTIVHFPAK